MPHASSPAIVLRVTEHGDFDKIITCLARKRGKISLIAKGAKKSIKRFAGILELFSVLNLVWSFGRGRGLPVLQEASVVHAFEQIYYKNCPDSPTYSPAWLQDTNPAP
jgi:DNA repair protein RecO (recombination protein O)